MSKVIDPSYARAWVEVDPDALRANYTTVQASVGPGTRLIPMVKADGYGLGAQRVVQALDPLDPWGYGVASAMEGAALRRAGVERPIIVFSPLPPQSVELAVEHGLIATISDLGGLERWAAAAERAARPVEFHAEVDTGMGRAGFPAECVEEWGAALLERTGPRVRWTGLFTHFHSADSADCAAAQEQWRRFGRVLEQLPVPRGTLLVHAGNSAASLRWPEYGLDAVRPGIFLYGGSPAPAVEGMVPPRPVASVRARVVLVRDVAPGTTVGYGATHVAKGPERWATLAIGYGDGLRRILGNRGCVLLRGRRARMVGRISMDMTVVDVTDIPDVQAGDIATVLGTDGAEEIRVDEMAEQCGTISYEILTGWTPRLPRVDRL